MDFIGSRSIVLWYVYVHSFIIISVIYQIIFFFQSGGGGSLCTETSELFKQLLATMTMVDLSQILREIRHYTTGWNPGIAEIDLLAQSLLKSVDYIKGNLNEEDLFNLQIIIQQVLGYYN